MNRMQHADKFHQSKWVVFLDSQPLSLDYWKNKPNQTQS
jgi:hypothetical protein